MLPPLDGSDRQPTPVRLLERHERTFGSPPTLLARAPGRVNLLGGHIDYSEGWVLPGAITQAVWISARPRDDSLVRVITTDLGQECCFDLRQLDPPLRERCAGRGPDWSDYFRGVAWAADDAVGGGQGCDLTVASSLPMGVGVSSSAALAVAQLLIWWRLSGSTGPVERTTRTLLALRARRFENDYLGVQSGLMDPYASLHGQAGQLLLLDCRSEEHTTVPWPEDRSLLLIDSGVTRRLAGSEFNDRRAECAEAVELLRRTRPEIRTLRDLRPEELKESARHLPERLYRRARHVSTECRRVVEGARALRTHDWRRFAEQVIDSHRSSQRDYETTIPELDLIAETAWRHPDCDGARLSGAGFGGAVLAVVRRDQVEDLKAEICSAYRSHFDLTPTFLPVEIGEGASIEAV